MANKYLPRLCDKILSEKLESKGAVLIEGLKWCGKTTTAEQAANSILYMQRPSTREQNIRLAQLAPEALLEGDVPRLIDEWQEAPVLWDAVRFEVDQRGETGQFILTGSSVPVNLDEVSHTGTGRISRMAMGTMSLLESGDSSGEISLKELFCESGCPIVKSINDIDQIAFLVCRGGWPQAVRMSDRAALRQGKDYLDAVVNVDVSKVDGVSRNPHVARLILRSYARMVASQGSFASMREDLKGELVQISESTFYDYVGALRKLFLFSELPAWSPNLRSKTAIRTSPTRHLADPSIAAAALGATSDRLISDLETFGLLFESMCVRDLNAYMHYLNGELFHYRDKNGLECDAVAVLQDGSFGLIEIKLGGSAAIESGAKTLKKLANKIDIARLGAPAFLMVLTGMGEYSYQREDGVLVIPVQTLGV